MDLDTKQEHRRKRLQDAADKVGGKAALGRLLKFKDGSYVGQMIRGERPITEDLVAALESKHGFHHWFSENESPEGDDMAMDPTTREVATLMMELTEKERITLLARIRPEVAQMLGDRILAEKFKVTGYAGNDKVSKTIKPAPRHGNDS